MCGLAAQLNRNSRGDESPRQKAEPGTGTSPRREAGQGDGCVLGEQAGRARRRSWSPRSQTPHHGSRQTQTQRPDPREALPSPASLAVFRKTALSKAPPLNQSRSLL